MTNQSKKIIKADESSKLFIMELLGNNVTHGIDVDSLYYTRDDKWLVLEFCKCDTVDPYDSHPNRYAFNWKKFVSLFELNKKLEGEFWVINYSKKEEWKNHIKIIKVSGIRYEIIKEAIKLGKPKFLDYLDAEEERMELNKFKELFNEINKSSKGPWGQEI